MTDETVLVKSDVYPQRDGTYRWTCVVPQYLLMLEGKGTTIAGCYDDMHAQIKERIAERKGEKIHIEGVLVEREQKWRNGPFEVVRVQEVRPQ